MVPGSSPGGPINESPANGAPVDTPAAAEETDARPESADYVMNADGTGVTRATHNGNDFNFGPDWGSG